MGRGHPSLAVLLYFGLNTAFAQVALPPHLARLPAGALEVGPAPELRGQGKSTGAVALWLPGGHRALRVEAQHAHPSGATTLIGALAGGGHAAYTYDVEGGFARIVADGQLWLVEMRDGRSYVKRVGPGGLLLAPDDLVDPDAVQLASRPAGPAKAGAALSVIDVHAIYDPDFAQRYPGGLAETRIFHFVALANQALVDSRIDAVLRVVGVQAIPMPAAGDASSNINALRAAASGQPGDLAFSGVGEQREVLGADIVSLFRVHDLYARGACGIAAFPRTDDGLHGVNVNMDGEDGGSVCDDLVFAHEIGHNLGAGHQLPDSGMESRSHAFVRLGQFNTLMGSFGTGRPDRFLRLGVWSNPNIRCGGMACGHQDANNAATMNAFRAQVAGYRAARVAGGGTALPRSAPDSDVDGVADAEDAFPFDRMHQRDRDRDGVADGLDAFPDDRAEWLDTDGGGQGDEADIDDDGDGTPDSADRFPKDARESSDADGDGVGDNRDAFDADASEWLDTDGDGVGDGADLDDDGDGIPDFHSGGALADYELLVMDRRIAALRRHDAATGAPLGVLVALAPGEVSFRSQLLGQPDGTLYFIAGSELRRTHRQRATLPVSVLNTSLAPAFGTGFPNSLAAFGRLAVFLGELSSGRVGVLLPRTGDAVFYSFSGFQPHLASDGVSRLYVASPLSGILSELEFHQPANPIFPNFNTRHLAFITRTSRALARRADGDLFAIESADGSIRRLDIDAGAPLGTPLEVFVAPSSGGLSEPVCLGFGPDGHLYVCSSGTGEVLRFDGASGAPLGVAVSHGAGGAEDPVAIAFVPRVLDTELPPLPELPPPVVNGTDPPPRRSGGGGGGLDWTWFGLALLWGIHGRARRRAASGSV